MDDTGDDVVEKALLDLIQQKMAEMQDEEYDDKQADTQLWHKLFKLGRKALG